MKNSNDETTLVHII